MNKNAYAENPKANQYPVKELTVEEKNKIDGLHFKFEELNADHIVYGLSHAFGSLFHNIWETMNAIVGFETTTEITYNMGVRYGVINLTKFLKARGLKKGSPSLMCEFQDKIHSVRGPVHISARFGEFDEEKCVIKRKRCFYNEWAKEETRDFIQHFYRGLYDGYMKADPALKGVENPNCLSKGDNHCTHIFNYGILL